MFATRQRAARLLAVTGLTVIATTVLAITNVLAASAAPATGPSQRTLPAQLPAQDDIGFVETPYGPLGPADRDLLVRVRYAGLWEVPAGQMAAEKGSTEQIREIGTFIAQEHIELDEMTLDAAAELGVALPTEVHPDNQVFLDRMEAREGEDFDFEFIQRLREAHGEIYPLIAYVRSGTQNDFMRDFAKTGEEFVNRHMDYLESSGLVDWFHIPPPPEPHGTKSRFLSVYPAGVNPALIWLLLGVAAVGGGVTVVRTVRPR